MYSISIRNGLITKLKKLRKKDPVAHARILKKIGELKKNPELGKPLRYSMKNIWRMHIGHFVITYEINENEKIIILVDYEHHDKAY